MTFAALDPASLGRSLAQIAEQEGDHAELMLERQERVELPARDDQPGVLARREQGLAVRLLRQGRTWLASQDGLDAAGLERAMRRVARALPQASYVPSLPAAEAWEEPIQAPELIAFRSALEREIHARHVAFPLRCQLVRHRRWVQIVGTRLLSEVDTESYYSLVAELPWGRFGTLLPRLDDGTMRDVAGALVDSFRARQAPTAVAAGPGVAVLGPAACAVFLHEAVAHALEADTLALGGRPDAACGVRLGSRELNVLDDPGNAPEEIRRTVDDEGTPVIRRWLLQQGEVREPLADILHASTSLLLSPGAGRRASRHLPPVPRSYHLSLLATEEANDGLFAEADGGLYLPLASRGELDPVGGEFCLYFPFARRISGAQMADYVGPCRLRGRVADLLNRVTAVGAEASTAGAGWCAKGGQRLPVWACCPPTRLEGVTIES